MSPDEEDPTQTTHIQDGTRCSQSHCFTLDFLPFLCSQCNRQFCKDHSTAESHQCIGPSRPDRKVTSCNDCGARFDYYVTSDSQNESDIIDKIIVKHKATKTCAKSIHGESKSRNKCPVDGCREFLGPSNRVNCPKCRQTFCLSHRHVSAHSCPGKPVKKQSSNTQMKAMSNTFMKYLQAK